LTCSIGIKRSYESYPCMFWASSSLKIWSSSPHKRCTLCNRNGCTTLYIYIYIYIYIYKWYEAMDGQDEYMKINILPVGNWEPWDPCCWQLNLLRAHLSPSCWWTSPIIAPGHTSYAYAHTHENVFYLFQCSALIYPFFHDVYLD